MMAAASYAFPSSTTVEHGGGHVHSHSRKSMTQRVPLQPTSMNGGHSINGGPLPGDLKSHAHANPNQESLEDFPSVDEDHFDSKTNLPSARLQSQSSSATMRPKGMDRRRSVGLPTHLSLRESGYGYQPASNQKFMPVEEEAERKWITPSEISSVALIFIPLLVASLFQHDEQKSQSTKQQSTTSDFVNSITKAAPGTLSTFEPGMLSTCAITSAVLLLMGFTGRLFGSTYEPDRKKKLYRDSADADKSQLTQVTFSTARSVLGRILSIALPFYASAKVGASRVTLVTLIALATKLMAVDGNGVDFSSIKSWKRLLIGQRWSLASILLQIGCDSAGLTNQITMRTAWVGYVALGVSIVALPPPFSSSRPKASAVANATAHPRSAGSAVLAKSDVVKPTETSLSPLICTIEDTNTTLIAGGLLGAISCIIFFVSKESAGALDPMALGWFLLSVCATVLSYTFAQPYSIRQSKHVGLAAGALMCAFLSTVLHHDLWPSFAYQCVFISVSLAAIKQDTQSLFFRSAHPHRDHHRESSHTASHDQPSRVSETLLRLCQNWPLLHSILAEKDSRRIFYFMSLNFAFMIVQTFYGIATGSLGLLSDSIHMFFDCLALVVGLCAAVMSKWPPSIRFPYGFGKVDTLAGFANGIFLMLISIEIVYEAIERLSEGVEMQRIGELLTVSSMGLAVNLVGMTAFGHAHHGHSHGGRDYSGPEHSGHSHQDHDHAHHDHHDHALHTHPEHSEHEHQGHTHERHDHNHAHDHPHTGSTLSTASPYSVPPTPSKPIHAHSHAHAHGHSHGNENMHGIFLHVLADTLGSVAVVISTLLIHYYGWAGFDPLASCLIAILIFASAIPLVVSSARTLLLTIPEDTEFDLREALAGVSALRGVVEYAVPKFWLAENEERKVLGVIHVIAGKGTNMEDIKERTVAFLKARNLDVLVQVEREESSACWCKGALNR